MKNEIPPGVIKGAIVALVLIVLLVAGSRAWAYEGKAAASAAAKNQQVVQIDAQIQQAQQVVNNPKKWHAQQVTLENAIPVSFGLDNVILVITQLAQKTGVEWTQGSPPSSQAIKGSTASPSTSTSTATAPPTGGSAPTISGVSSQDMTIQVKGSLGQLEGFIQGISELPRLITLTGMQVTPGTAASGTSGKSTASSGGSSPTSLASQISASMSLVVYSLNS